MFWITAAQVVFTFAIFYTVVTRHDASGEFATVGIVVGMTVAVIQAGLFIGDSWWSNLLGYVITALSVLLLIGAWKEGKELQDIIAASPRIVSPTDNVDSFVARRRTKSDVIRFSYVNQKGEYSTRRVKVQRLAKSSFTGIDMDKIEQRTFRYDSVVGGITSEETGESFHDAEQWRDSVR